MNLQRPTMQRQPPSRGADSSATSTDSSSVVSSSLKSSWYPFASQGRCRIIILSDGSYTNAVKLFRKCRNLY